jgi:hypothetical protein
MANGDQINEQQVQTGAASFFASSERMGMAGKQSAKV